MAVHLAVSPGATAFAVLIGGLFVLADPASAQQADGIDAGYAPLGVRAGAFTVLPSLDVSSGYTDNANRDAMDRQASSLVTVAPGLAIRSGWSRHSVSGELRGSYTRFPSATPHTEGFFEANVNGRVDIRESSGLEANARYRFDRYQGVGDQQATVLARLTQRLARWRASLTGALNIFAFGDNRAGLNSAARTDVADYDEAELRLRLSYDVSPQTAVFAESGVNRRNFRDKFDAGGQRRGSDGLEAAVGMALNNGSKFSGEVALGYRLQRPDDSTLKDLDGLTLDARLLWQATGLTSVTLSAGTELGETTLAGSPGFVARRAGVRVDHALRRNVTLRAAVDYERADFSGVDLVEKTYQTSIGVEYLMNRNVALLAEISHLRFDTSSAGQDYHANRFSVGMRVQQ